MSESTVPFTPGSGLNLRAILRTVGINNVLDEVIELSDQSGVLITPLAERDLIADGFLGSGKSGLPAFGYDSTYLAWYPIPLLNGQVNVVAGGGPVTNNPGVFIGNPAGSNQTIITATNPAIYTPTIAVGNPTAVIVAVDIAGTYSATLVFEVQSNVTGSWYGVKVKNLVTGLWITSITVANTTGFFEFPALVGATSWRVRATSIASGTVNVGFSASAFQQGAPQFATPTGQLVPPEAVYLGGTDGTTLRGISVKNANPLTTDYGAFIRTLFQQLPNAALPSHTLWMGASDATNLQGLLVESAANPNLFTAIRQGTNQLGINASNQAAIQNPPNLDTALSTRLADAKFPSTAALGDATANPTLTAVQDYQMLFNGSTWDRMKSSGVTGMAGIGGDTASAASDAGNPVKIGGVANTGLPTAVTTGQRTNLLTDVYGRPRVLTERPKLLGVYYAESGNITVLATAHTALQGFMWLVNTSATVKVYIRSIGFVWSGTAATAFPTSPRITVERVTFTGTPSGAAITPAKRDSTDAANTATLNTASTGLTLTGGAVIESFLVGSIFTAVGAVSVPEEIWQPENDDALIVLRQNEGIVIRQPDAGTAADTRKIVMTLSWEER